MFSEYNTHPYYRLVGLSGGYGEISCSSAPEDNFDSKVYSEAKSASWGRIKSIYNNGGDIDDDEPDGKRDKD